MRKVNACSVLTSVYGTEKGLKCTAVIQELEMAHAHPPVINCRRLSELLVDLDPLLELLQIRPTLDRALQSDIRVSGLHRCLSGRKGLTAT